MLRTAEANPIQRVLIEIYGLSVGLLLFSWGSFLHLFSRIRMRGREHIPVDTPAIFCCWHGTMILAHNAFYPSYPRKLAGRPMGWMFHPAWIFHGFVRFIQLMGVRHVAIGTSGQGGRAAADELVSLLKSGCSIFLCPDGPMPGPPRQLKKGALHMALQAGVPIVPLRFTARGCYRLWWDWDNKYFPLPFCRIDGEIAPPIRVTEATFAACAEELQRALG